MNKIVIVSMFGMATISCLQASEFKNLDFESANTNNVTSVVENIVVGTTQDLLPGWSLKKKTGESVQTVFYNSETPGGLPHAILELNDEYKSFPIEGQYGLLLVSDSTDPLFVSQTGTIPAGDKYIMYTTLNHVSLSINGTELQLSETKIWVDNIANPWRTGYEVWADVSAYSGQEVNMTFGSDVLQPLGFGCGIDSIQFTSSIPEPSAVAFLSMGYLVFMARKHAFRK